jgi:hypothetical protein
MVPVDMTDPRTKKEGPAGAHGGTAPRLPANRAFLVRFDEQAAPPGSVSGRIEHVTSGAVAHVNSLEELLAFVATILRDGDLEHPTTTDGTDRRRSRPSPPSPPTKGERR